MAEDGDDAEARLEPPSLFRRRKRRQPAPPADVPPAAEPESEEVAGPAPVADPAPVAGAAPVAEVGKVVEAHPEADPVLEADPVVVVEPVVDAEVASEGQATEPAPAAPVPPAKPRRTRPARRPAAPVVGPPPTPPTPPTPLPAPEPAPEPAPAAAVAEGAADWTVPAVPEHRTDVPELRGELEPAPPREPWLTGPLAAVVTGLVAGILVVALTAAGEHLCTALKGTSSCGGPGLFLLIAILLVAVLVGTAMLRAAQVRDPGSTSVLGVGLLSVLILLLLVGSIFSWWMIIVIPVFSMGSFALSHWVTTAVVTDGDEVESRSSEPDTHDVR